MDWKLKTDSWEFTQFQREAVPNMDFLNGSSGIDSGRNSGEFLVDLKLGQMGDSGDEDKWRELTGSKKVASSVKRARAANGGNLPVSCLVDGCDSDLGNCREYHRRHKVCEKHSKTPEVTIGGHKKRFCQQCSRFHSVEEFDDEKRSCRKRLDGHNRRRRKAQPEPPLHSGSYASRYRGMELSPYSSPAIYPSNAAPSATWPGVHDHHKQHVRLLEKQVPFYGSFSSCLGGGTTQFTFLQGSDLYPHAQTSSIAGTPLGLKFSADGLLDQVPDPPRAPSLLSLPQTRTSGINLSHAQPSLLGLQYESLGRVDSENATHSNGTDAQCEGMFRTESSSKAPETIPFYWE